MTTNDFERMININKKKDETFRKLVEILDNPPPFNEDIEVVVKNKPGENTHYEFKGDSLKKWTNIICQILADSSLLGEATLYRIKNNFGQIHYCDGLDGLDIIIERKYEQALRLFRMNVYRNIIPHLEWSL